MKTTLIAIGCAVAGIMCTPAIIDEPTSGIVKSSTQIDFKGIVCVQYNADWNAQNRYPDIPGVKNYYVDISRDPSQKDRMKIKTIPTLVFFKDGKEFKRVDGGLMFKITAPVQQIKSQMNEGL